MGREWATVAKHLGIAKAPQPGPSPSLEPDEGLGASARNAKANRELLREMYYVVLDQDPAAVGSEHKGEYVRLVEVLNQGASLEGIYNGITHSEEFRALERSGKTASPEFLKMFAELLIGLERELPTPTVFTEASARPIEVLSMDQLAMAPIQYPEKGASPKPAGEMSVETYTKLFASAAPFTLKRVLGDEALKVVAAKRGDAKVLGAWFGKWAVQMNSFGIDFGITLRNRQDEGFHTEWARDAGAEHVAWEVLTRLHRILNETARKKTS